MTEARNSIPDKRYFNIAEVADLCGVKPHVLRYWEKEFPQLRNIRRRGNRRFYRRKDIELIQQIKLLVHHEGLKISAARKKLSGKGQVDISKIQPCQIIEQLRSIQRILREN